MASTTTDALNDSMDVVLAAARRTREHAAGFQRTVMNVTLAQGTGLNWREALYSQLNAFAVTEDQEFDNPETITDSVITFRPQFIVVQHFILDEVGDRMSAKGFSELGALAQEAAERRVDEDGLVTLDSFTTTLGTANVTVNSNTISAGISRIQGNATEPGDGPYHTVQHPFAVRAIQNELTAPLGTYPIAEGPTAAAIRGGFALAGDMPSIYASKLWGAGNLAIDANSDATGGIYAEGSIVLVRGKSATSVAVRNEKRGGGGSDMIYREQYVYGIRNQNWGFSWIGDATSPS